MLRSIGYRGRPLDGIPFDERRGLIANEGGRVGAPGEYCVGWIKRGPSGVIGTNKKDAADTVARILEDEAAGTLGTPGGADADAVAAWLAERVPDAVTWEGWQAIDAAESAAGEAQGRPRVKLVTLAELREAGAAHAGRWLARRRTSTAAGWGGEGAGRARVLRAASAAATFAFARASRSAMARRCAAAPRRVRLSRARRERSLRRRGGAAGSGRRGPRVTPPPHPAAKFRALRQASRAASRPPAGTCAGSMWCAASDSWYSTGRPPASSSSRARRAKPTSMTGSLRPWAMNARVPVRSASEGCQPSTVGTKPEKARMPAGAGRSRAEPERVAHHRAHREAAEHRPLRRRAGALPQLVVQLRERARRRRGTCRGRGSRRAARRTSGSRASPGAAAARAG